jgi:hypothetical protein
LDFRARIRKCSRPTVWAIADEHFKRLCHCDNARAQRNSLAFQTLGIAGSVEPLAVRAHNLRSDPERRLSAHDLVPIQTVLAHDEPLLRSQNRGLSEDRLRNLKLANFVEQRAASNSPNLFFIQSRASAKNVANAATRWQ